MSVDVSVRPASERRPRFLVIRRDNIGDLVCTTPLIAALRRRYPDAHIAALVNTYNEAVLAGNADVDAVYAYRKGKHRGEKRSLFSVYAERLRLILHLRQQAFDYAILATPGFARRSLRLARMVGARHVLGYVEPGKSNRRIDIALQYRRSAAAHQVEEVFGLLRALDVEGPPPPLKLFPDPRLVEDFKKRLPDHGAITVGVHLSAREADRRWPDAKFVDLIRVLDSNHHATVVLTWAPGGRENPLFPGDDDSARQVAASCSGARVLALPTPELAHLIASVAVCDCVICSDGAAVHLAAALGKPVVCMFGGEKPEYWHPWRVPYRLLQPPSRQVRDISVDEVREAFASLLEETRSPRGQAGDRAEFA